jgi:hypothetical protein
MLLAATPLLAGAVVALLAMAVRGGLGAELGRHGATRMRRIGLRGVVALLHVLQPAARLLGRLSEGLAPWRARRIAGTATPRRRVLVQWFECWQPGKERVAGIEAAARRARARVVRGGPYDRWDLELAGGAIGSARLVVAVEEHGRGTQLLRCRVWPHVARSGSYPAVALALLAGAGAFAQRWLATGVLSGLLAGLLFVTAWECASATGGVLSILEDTVETRRTPAEETTATAWRAARPLQAAKAEET